MTTKEYNNEILCNHLLNAFIALAMTNYNANQGLLKDSLNLRRRQWAAMDLQSFHVLFAAIKSPRG